MRVVRTTSVITVIALALILGGGTALIGYLADIGAWIGLVPFVVVLWGGLRSTWRRWRVAQEPFADEWRQWLRQYVPLYRELDAEARDRFERDMKFFMDEYRFEGVEGVTVTDELRLSVAAGAAVLLHGRPDFELPGTRSILFYPDRFDDDYFYGDDHADYEGMVHEQGPIVLSAQATLDSWRVPTDGVNVVLHELAHLFDFENTGPDGIPSLINPASEQSWKELVRREMDRVERGSSLLDPYAATAPSEFFAVAVETFYGRPYAMYQQHPDLFAALRAFFNLDPRTGELVHAPDGEQPAET